MNQNRFEKLLEIKKDAAVVYQTDDASFALCPDLGGRVFVQIKGHCPHRIDLDTVLEPKDTFNNYGGSTFWPAPEGGKFGFNYQGDTWRVQEAINRQPFEIKRKSETGAVIFKRARLINRMGTEFAVLMRRTFSICQPDCELARLNPRAIAAYETVDEFEVLDKVTVDKALIASWSLEQCSATDDTISFCIVEEPSNAINFDFYEHAGDRIEYFNHGFTYKTDGKKAGQIGIKVASKPRKIGFYDKSNNLLCTRKNLSVPRGVYFNIADNDQPAGPYSAADCYSMFNSDPEMAAFELETVGTANILGNVLTGSRLQSRTTFALFDDAGQIDGYIESSLGGRL